MRVLIASDLSEASDEAVRQGLQIAGSGAVALCHVVPDLGMHALLPQEYENDLRWQVSQQPRVAEALRGQLERVVPGREPAPELFVELGADYDQILRRAEQWQADLIALGTHGRRGISRLLLGSTADQVVRAATCPVLIARPARSTKEGAVLAAVDFSDPSLPVVTAAAAEAKRRGRKLVVMHAMERPRDGDAAMGLLGALPALETPEVHGQKRALAAEILNDALARLHAHGEIVVTEDDPGPETLRLAESLPAELIVVGTHPRGRLSRLVLGSMAASIVESAPCSVLVARERIT
jgi:nucleotide-binding universal stress UspA family protein